MKIDLNSIYKYTKILLMTLIIINMINACAKAVTYDDVKKYVEATADYFPNNSVYQQLKSNVNLTSVKNGINAMNISNYNSFIVWSQQVSRGNDITYYFFNASTWNTSTQSISFQGQYISGYYSTYWNQWYGSNNVNNNNINNILAGGQFYSRTENDYNNLRAMMYTFDDLQTTPVTFVGMQAIDTNPFYYGHMYSVPYIYQEEELEANTLDYNYRIEFIENIVTEENEVTEIDATLDLIPLETQNLGSYWTLKCNNSTLLKYNKVYKVEAKITTPDDIYIIEENMVFVPPGTVIENGIIIRTPSGDFTFSTENATNQIIDNNNNFFTDLNEMLFAFNSGDIQNAINDIKEKFNFSGDDEVEQQIIEIAMQNNGDFKISWNAFTPHLSVKNQQLTYERPMIPSGEINFSQIERENEAFQQTMYWTRLILSFALITLIAREYTKLILDAVGGSVLLADHDKESNRIIDGGDKK